MKKTVKLIDLECANCAAKMERAIQKIAGVQSASVQFMSQRLTLEAEEDDWDRILAEVARVIAKIEPQCKMIL